MKKGSEMTRPTERCQGTVLAEKESGDRSQELKEAIIGENSESENPEFRRSNSDRGRGKWSAIARGPGTDEPAAS